MKILVKDLKPNPYRKMKQYPINKEKIESLKISIEDTTFWDNLVAREKNGVVEIAYGHHRLIALQELDIKEIDIPIREINDAHMIKIMANENLDNWGTTPAVYTESVLVAKEYLDGELAKYESWGKAKKSYLINLLDRNLTEGKFQDLKKSGVGQTTLLKFLGGNWKQHIIQDALNTLNLVKKKKISKKSIDKMPTKSHSEQFKIAMKKYNIPLDEQDGIASQIKKEEIGRGEIDEFVKDYAERTGILKKKPKLTPKKKKDTPTINDFIENIIQVLSENLIMELYKIEGQINYITPGLVKDTLKLTFNELSDILKKLKEEF